MSDQRLGLIDLLEEMVNTNVEQSIVYLEQNNIDIDETVLRVCVEGIRYSCKECEYKYTTQDGVTKHKQSKH